MTTQYEYRVVRFDMKWSTMATKFLTDTEAIERQMNALGAEGWELVKVSEIIVGTVYTVSLIAFFKRLLPASRS
jgi:hypothetical protein